MLINRAIGFDPDEGMGIDGAAFQQELFDLDNQGYKCIKVFINSPGGAVMDGYNIFNAILKTKTPVDTYNVGIAASIAGVIFMAGRKRIMADYSQFMMHNPFGGNDKKQLTAMKDSLVTALSSRSGLKDADVAYMMDRTTWMSPSECLEKGFCTDIEVSNDHNQKYMPSTARAMWAASNKILNNIFKNSDMEPISGRATGLSLIANYLELNVDSTENSVLNAVKTRINAEVKAKEKAEEGLDKMKKELDKMKADFDEMKEKYDKACKDAKDAKDKAEKDAKDAENKVKEEQDKSAKAVAKVKVGEYAAAGRIKSDEPIIEKWVNLWVTDPDGTKEILEAIPMTKVGNHINTGGTGNGKPNKDANGKDLVDPNVVPMSAMHQMARVQANANTRNK